MKKQLAWILVLTLCLTAFSGCGAGASADTKGDPSAYDYDAIPDTMEADSYELAFVADLGQLKDKSFNQGTWDGLKRYASENGKTYKYYQPANGDQATDNDRYETMKLAVQNGAKLVVSCGFLQQTAIQKTAAEFPEVSFVIIDGWPMDLPNLVAIDFREEQSGFLAGYAAVKEGYTQLGFSGGGGGKTPACCRFGYGYLQGAETAAKEMGIDRIPVNFSWEYGASFAPSAELQTMLNGWYSSGTEIIFMCGGAMCKSGFAAAAANDGMVIGVDVDQSGESDTVLTSATKGLQEAVMEACHMYYSGNWDQNANQLLTLGVSENAVGLPTETWSMENFTLDQYREICDKMAAGEITVDRDYENGLKPETFSIVDLNII